MDELEAILSQHVAVRISRSHGKIANYHVELGVADDHAHGEGDTIADAIFAASAIARQEGWLK